MPELPERTALYRLYDASDRLLYIGIAKDTKKRWKDHELIQRWWHLVARHTITWLPSREQALAVEEKTVREETPSTTPSASRTGGTSDSNTTTRERFGTPPIPFYGRSPTASSPPAPRSTWCA